MIINCVTDYAAHIGAGDWAEGNMWPCSAFAAHLDANCGQKGLWHNHIQPQMQRIVQYSLACATVRLPPSAPCLSLLPLKSLSSCVWRIHSIFSAHASIYAEEEEEEEEGSHAVTFHDNIVSPCQLPLITEGLMYACRLLLHLSAKSATYLP